MTSLARPVSKIAVLSDYVFVARLSATTVKLWWVESGAECQWEQYRVTKMTACSLSGRYVMPGGRMWKPLTRQYQANKGHRISCESMHKLCGGVRPIGSQARAKLGFVY